MILPKVGDPRFVTIRRGGTLTDSDHHLLAVWAALPATATPPTRTRTPSTTPSITNTPNPAHSPTRTRTSTRTPTSTKSITPTTVRTSTKTRTPTKTGCATPTVTRTPTSTRTPVIPTAFPTPTSQPTPILALIPAGQAWRFYYFAGAQRIAMRYKDSYGYNVEGYLLSDHLPPPLRYGGAARGSTYKTISNTGEPVGELRYREASCKDYPFGETRLASGTTPTDYRFTGQLSQMDGVGLYYYGARWPRSAPEPRSGEWGMTRRWGASPRRTASSRSRAIRWIGIGTATCGIAR